MQWLSAIFRSFAQPFKWWIVVAPWEQGLRVRLGKSALVLRPGVHFRIPFLDRVYLQSVRRRTIVESNQVATTKDGKSLCYSIAIDFCVRDILALFNTLSSPELTITSHVLNAVVCFCADRKMDTITPSVLEAAMSAAIDLSANGLANVSCRVVQLSASRAYKLMTSEYRSGAGLESLEDGHDAGKHL